MLRKINLYRSAGVHPPLMADHKGRRYRMARNRRIVILSEAKNPYGGFRFATWTHEFIWVITPCASDGEINNIKRWVRVTNPNPQEKIAKFIFRVFSSVSWVICCCWMPNLILIIFRKVRLLRYSILFLFSLSKYWQLSWSEVIEIWADGNVSL